MTNLEIISWVITIASATGGVLNAKGNINSFYIWIVANLSWVGYDIYIGQYAQAALFVFYTLTCLYGIWQWRKHHVGSKR